MSPAVRLLPYDPTHQLLERVALVLREGVAQWSAMTGSPAWGESDPAPAGHFLAPEGARLFIDRVPGPGVKCDPAITLRCPDEGKEKSEEVSGAWAITMFADVMSRRGADLDAMELLLQRIQFMVTHPIKLDLAPGQPIQQPQERLNTASLHVFGSHHRANFEETMQGKVEYDEDHPIMRFSTRITCGLYAEIP